MLATCELMGSTVSAPFFPLVKSERRDATTCSSLSSRPRQLKLVYIVFISAVTIHVVMGQSVTEEHSTSPSAPPTYQASLSQPPNTQTLTPSNSMSADFSAENVVTLFPPSSAPSLVSSPDIPGLTSEPSSSILLTSTPPTIVSVASVHPSHMPSLALSDPTADPVLPPTTSPPTPGPAYSNGPSQLPSLTTAFPSTYPTSIEPDSPVPSVSLVPSTLTMNPSDSLSFAPSNSKTPSAIPSSLPSSNPSLSLNPSEPPSQSLAPSVSPTSSHPTSLPSEAPTFSPVISPSSAPSWEEEVSFRREHLQRLFISQDQLFDDLQTRNYEFLMQRYTKEFGYEVGPPAIISNCTLISQQLGTFRKTSTNMHRHVSKWEESGFKLETEAHPHMSLPVKQPERGLQNQNGQFILTIRFSMGYSTRYGYNLDQYNALFANHINANLTAVTIDMQNVFLPVISAREVIIFADQKPTGRPTKSPSVGPTHFPTVSPTSEPSGVPSVRPSSTPSPFPSSFPSASPSFIVQTNDDFVLGLSLGLAGVLVAALLAFFYYRYQKGRQKPPSMISQNIPETTTSKNAELVSHDTGNFGVPKKIHDTLIDNKETLDEFTPKSEKLTQDAEPVICEPSKSVEPAIVSDMEQGVRTTVPEPTIQPFDAATMDSIFSVETSSPVHDNYNDLYAVSPRNEEKPYAFESSLYTRTNLLTHNASFSSDPDDEVLSPFQLDGSHDEFDNYKNQDLETLRNEVEEAIDNVDGMMSLAMTRALTEPEESNFDAAWAEVQDQGSIEASCLCDAYDWVKKNEYTTTDARNHFFQEALNRVVVAVLFGTIRPHNGSRLLHGCATIIGMPLLKQLPLVTLIIQGMRKTNDVAQGHHFILEAFMPFGEIADAAIAPNNRGFGFVRFVHPKSVQRALERYRFSEIEIQDVSVSIKLLRSEASKSS